MKNVYFVLANQRIGYSMYLPYASGCLAAYAWQSPQIREEFRCAGFFYKREPIADVIAEMDDPDVVAFSSYMWTREYNVLLARAIREKYPDCLLVFGGHEIAEQAKPDERFPDADLFIVGEGEEPFREILLARCGGNDYSAVPNIAYRTDAGLVFTPQKTYDTLDYPSPYLTGMFDEIIAREPGVDFCITIETNRGCPYQCAYCDWCFTSSIREFPLEKVFAEIEWCAQHRIDYVYCADGNFGILPRDYQIAEFAVNVKKRCGYPRVFNACYAKNSNENVFRISKLLFDNRMNKAITLAFQTLCPTALENINRQNFTLEKFSELIDRYNQCGIPTYTEMILGLPGETKQSFCEGICQLVEAGQHNALTVYDCQVFPNSLMGNKTYQDRFGIESAHVKQVYIHLPAPGDDEIIEYTDMVTATKDMSFADMVDSLLFSVCVQCFHHIGMLRYFAIFVRRELQVSYYVFYSSLFDYIENAEGTLIHSLLRQFRAECTDLSRGEWTYFNEKFGNIGWYYEEGLFMELASELDRFSEEIRPFLASFPIEKDLLEELCRYQKFVIRQAGQTVVKGSFRYDFFRYFSSNDPRSYEKLRKIGNELEITVPEFVPCWQDYGKVMLFAKKKGATLLTTDPAHVRITYGGRTAEQAGLPPLPVRQNGGQTMKTERS
ncbi:MAG: radical SAM protein [Clostridia bacterium]|nr:radical SAM protein [Clostridia bacterium]